MKKRNRLSSAVLEMATDLHRVGIVDDQTLSEIEARHLDKRRAISNDENKQRQRRNAGVSPLRCAPVEMTSVLQGTKGFKDLPKPR